MSFSNNKELAENKLILLYIVDKIGMPVSNTHLTRIILENKFMNYFLLQQFLKELCDSSFLEHKETEGKSLYSITDTGKQTLSYFHHLIPAGIKGIIDNTVSDVKRTIKNETLITANFVPESENEYTVQCKINEDSFSLIDLKISVGTKNDARLICDNWKQHSQSIYTEIIEILTRKRG